MDYRVSLSLSVTDARALWSEAAMAALALPGTTLDDVVATLGSEHDPEIADCIALLLQPPRIAGATIHSFACRRAGRPGIVTTVVTPPRGQHAGLTAIA